jgi:hypothetical protein
MRVMYRPRASATSKDNCAVTRARRPWIARASARDPEIEAWIVDLWLLCTTSLDCSNETRSIGLARLLQKEAAMSCAVSYSYANSYDVDMLEALDEQSWIEVVQGDHATFIDPDSLPRLMVGGRTVIALTDLWATSGLCGKLSELMFHFTGDDGFASREECLHGMPAMLVDHAFIDVSTRDLVWTLEVPASFEVKRLASISTQHQSEVPALVISVD